MVSIEVCLNASIISADLRQAGIFEQVCCRLSIC